jgi:hypothetical protein
MASTHELPVTPRRKRASSEAILVPYGAVIKSEDSLQPQSTPGVHDVPELDWDDSPHPQDHSQRTPSAFTSPSKAPAADDHNEANNTQRRRVKASRASLMLQSYGASSPIQSKPKLYYASESGYIDLKPAPLFHYLYPTMPSQKKEESEILSVVPDLYKSKNFTFSRWARYSHKGSATSTPKFYMPCEERGPLQKRVKKEVFVPEQNVRYDTVTLITSPVSINAKIAYLPPNTGRISSVTTKRFSRILPFDTIERLLKQPNMCIASLVDRPDGRCTFPTRSSKNVKTRLLAQLVELDDPMDFIGVTDYLKYFIDTMTCNRHHHRIATEQLERLLDRYCDRRPKGTHSKHDFTWKDLDFLKSWLQGSTTLPEGRRILPVQQAEKANASAPIVDTIGSSEITVGSPSEKLQHFPTPNAVFLKVLQTMNISKSTREQPASEEKEPVQTITTINRLNRKPNVLAIKPDEAIIAIQEINIFEAEQINHSIENENSDQYIEVTKKHGVAEILVPIDQGFEKSKISMNTQITDVPRTIKPEEEVRDHNATVRIRISNNNEPLHTTWKYDAFQIYDFKFIEEAAQEPTQKESPRIQQRPKKPQVNLNQNFCWFYQDVGGSVQGHIYDRLHKDLTSREFEEGLIYMYWITGSFGFVKIGKTSGKSTEKRLNAWRKQCEHEIEEHTRDEGAFAEQLPHVYRIEALVHEELREVRLREQGCKGCGIWHQEWFLVSPEHARAVIQKWTKFMLSKPYDRYGRLKESITRERIEKLCQPVIDPRSVKHSRHSRPKSERDDR